MQGHLQNLQKKLPNKVFFEQILLFYRSVNGIRIKLVTFTFLLLELKL